MRIQVNGIAHEVDSPLLTPLLHVLREELHTVVLPPGAYSVGKSVADLGLEQGEVTITAIRRDGIVDRVIPELPDAAYEPEAFCARVGQALEHELIGLLTEPSSARATTRRSRYRTLGT